MDVMDIIKNPIVIGLLAGLITYMYMRWKNDNDKDNKDNKDKKKKKDINLLIPFSVFIVFWFISYAYFSNEDESEKSTEIVQVVVEKTSEANKNNLSKNNDINIKIKPTKNDMSETSEPTSFNMVSNGVYIPKNLPNIFFEMN
jgi:hypothetical protein